MPRRMLYSYSPCMIAYFNETKGNYADKMDSLFPNFIRSETIVQLKDILVYLTGTSRHLNLLENFMNSVHP